MTLANEIPSLVSSALSPTLNDVQNNLVQAFSSLMSQPSEEPPLSGSPSDDSFTTHLTSFRVNNMVARPRVGRSGSRSGLGTGIASNSPRNSVDQPSLSTAAAGSPPTSSSDSPILSSRNSVDSSVASAPEPKSSPPISIDEVSSKRASCVSKTPSTPIIAIERFSDAFWKGWLRKKRVGTMGIKRRYVVVKPHRIEYYKDPSVCRSCSF